MLDIGMQVVASNISPKHNRPRVQHVHPHCWDIDVFLLSLTVVICVKHGTIHYLEKSNLESSEIWYYTTTSLNVWLYGVCIKNLGTLYAGMYELFEVFEVSAT